MPGKSVIKECEINYVVHWYPIIVFGTVLLLAGLFVCALVRLSVLGPTDRTSSAASNVYFFAQQQQEIANRINGNRVILLGGSGVLYSVRSQLLQSELGVPVVNYGLMAGLGIEYFFYRARQTLRSGDTVVLFLEYGHFSRVGFRPAAADYVLPQDLDFFKSLSFQKQFELIGKLPPLDYCSRIVDAIVGKPVKSAPYLASINNNGDMIANKLKLKTSVHQEALDSYKALTGYRLKNENTTLVSRFIHWCKKNGVSVLAGNPAFLEFPEYYSTRERHFFQSLHKYYRSLNVPVLGSAYDFMFPKEMFFDSPYHLHDSGAKKMTLLVAKYLENHFKTGTDPISILYRFNRQNKAIINQYLFISLNDSVLPSEVMSLTGFAEPEDWGRWTSAPKVTIRFSMPLPHHFRLVANVVHILGNNSNMPVIVRVGSEERNVTIDGSNKIMSLEFQSDGNTKSIEFVLPTPKSPQELGLSDDPRKLGMGISWMEIVPLDLVVQEGL